MSEPAPELRDLRILLVEDDATYRRALRDLLQYRGARVLEADTAAAGFQCALDDAPDFVVADLRLPDGSGDELCRKLRRHGFDKALVLLTAHGDVRTQIDGFECGADEFWTKPMPLRLFELRIAALVRRAGESSRRGVDSVVLNGITFDFRQLTASRDGLALEFPPRELALLRALWLAQGAPVSRADLLARVWKYDRVPNSRTVDNLVVSLRRKIEPDPAHPRHLTTVTGFGYQLREN